MSLAFWIGCFFSVAALFLLMVAWALHAYDEASERRWSFGASFVIMAAAVAAFAVGALYR